MARKCKTSSCKWCTAHLLFAFFFFLMHTKRMETCLFTEGMICNNWWQTVTFLHSKHLQALAALISWQSMQHMTIFSQLAKLFPLSEGKAVMYGKLASHREHVLRKGNCCTPAFSSSLRLQPLLQGPLKPLRMFLFFFLATSKHVLRNLVVAYIRG